MRPGVAGRADLIVRRTGGVAEMVSIKHLDWAEVARTRRQAGKHAERLNVLFSELLQGHILSEEELKEVIGHTPLEVVGGIILGLLVAIVQWMVWK
mgnify:CR=1 FL=1